MAILIRKALRKDIPTIRTLLCQVAQVHADTRGDLFRTGGKKYSDRQIRAILRNKNTPVFVATNEADQVLGYAFCILYENKGHPLLTDISTLYIDDLCVEEAARAKGIGRALYHFVVDYAKKIGCYNVTLNVYAKNESALRFYQSCGLSVQKIGMEKIL